MFHGLFSIIALTCSSYYINPPGVSTTEACVWGDSSKPVGNWAPFVAGANTASDGNTYVKIGWNPIYTNAYDKIPEFGIEIICEGEGCNGLPCKFDPAANGFNELTGASTVGDGGASFCVVTVPSGQNANIVVFEASGSDSSTSSSSSSASHSTTSSSSSTAAATSSSASSTSSTSSADVSSKESHHTTATSTSTVTSSGSFLSTSTSYSYAPHVFIETGSSGSAVPTQTASMITMTSAASTTTSAKPAETSHSGAAATNALSLIGLVMTVFAGLLSSF